MNTRSDSVLTDPIRPTVWIGFLEIVGRHGSALLGEGKGACTNVLAPAADRQTFFQAVREELERLGVTFVELKNAGRFFDDFEMRDSVEKTLTDLANEVLESGAIRFTTWHVYDLERSKD